VQFFGNGISEKMGGKNRVGGKARVQSFGCDRQGSDEAKEPVGLDWVLGGEKQGHSLYGDAGILLQTKSQKRKKRGRGTQL